MIGLLVTGSHSFVAEPAFEMPRSFWQRLWDWLCGR
jgi:hypothetical protein